MPQPSWKPGDRFQPQGVGGTQTVAYFMINEKIPATWRDHIPLLVDQDGQILWVCGWRPDECARVTQTTRQAVRLQFERNQG